MPRSESGKKELVSEVSVSAAVSASGVNESGPVSESGLKEPVSLLFNMSCPCGRRLRLLALRRRVILRLHRCAPLDADGEIQIISRDAD